MIKIKALSREELADALVDRVRGVLEILLLVLLAELDAFVFGVQLSAEKTHKVWGAGGSLISWCVCGAGAKLRTS